MDSLFCRVSFNMRGCGVGVKETENILDPGVGVEVGVGISTEVGVRVRVRISKKIGVGIEISIWVKRLMGVT